MTARGNAAAGDRFAAAVLGLVQDAGLWAGDLRAALQRMVAIAGETVHGARASVWQLSADADRLDCVARQGAPGGESAPIESLSATACPAYFAALCSSRVLDAGDAVNDRRTYELASGYLAPQGIGSLLDAGIWRAGRLVGVLCFEHVGSPRLWNRQEAGFAVSVADLVSQVLVFHALRDSEARYRALFDAAGDAILLIRDDRVVDCNQRALEIFRCQPAEIVGGSPLALSPTLQPDGRVSVDRAAELIGAAVAGMPQFYEWRHRRRDGTTFDGEVSLNAVDVGGERLVQAIVRDVTARKLAEEALFRSRRELLERNTALQLINSLGNSLHGSLDVEAVAARAMRVLRVYGQAPMVGFYLLQAGTASLRLVAQEGFRADGPMPPAELPVAGSFTGRILVRRQPMVCRDVASDARLEAGARKVLLEAGIRMFLGLPLYARDEPVGVINIGYRETRELDATAIENYQAIAQTVSLAMLNARQFAQIEHQALHDSLTGLPNRVRLHEATREAIEAAPDSGRRPALMLLDLDGFKEVNDTLGHQAGDAVLKDVSARLVAVLPRPGTLLCRLGGDEFAVVVADAPTDDGLLALGARVAGALRQPFDVLGIPIEVGASIGMARYPDHGEDSSELLRCADVAMYAAKARSGRVAFYDAALDDHSPRRLRMMTELGTALREGGLQLLYQPKVDLRSQRCIGVEALLRWHHPTLGTVPPGEFVPLAENTDLIGPLSLWVLDAALTQVRGWRSLGIELVVAVNLSARNLLDAGFPSEVDRLLSLHAAAPQWLELEITETALITEPAKALANVERLAALGVRMSIDDFGTGYSSLAYLKRLPIHALKIDQSFVLDMLHNEQDAVIVNSTIGLAHSMRMEVVAEGVEDHATLAALAELGCDYAQGYCLGRPMPAEDLDGWLAARGEGLPVG
ncbi:MAG: EAL domain-containing protein [Gammaproteobacteria bacterium]|nr:EAL domain-containing protein [Gammaproteobacteria bacterium]